MKILHKWSIDYSMLQIGMIGCNIKYIRMENNLFKNFQWCSCVHETENSLSHHEKFWERDEAKFPMPPTTEPLFVKHFHPETLALPRLKKRDKTEPSLDKTFSYRMLMFMDVEAIVVTPREGKSRGESTFTSAPLRGFSWFGMARGSHASRGAAIWNKKDIWLSKQLLLTVGIAPHVQI